MNKKIILSLLLASAASFSLVGCSHAPVAPPVQITPTLVFIQGVHLDGQVWDATKSEIDSSAFHVMDLDRLGRDEKFPASLKEIASLSCHAIPAGSILVGHSYGGAIANESFSEQFSESCSLYIKASDSSLLARPSFHISSNSREYSFGQT